MARYFEAPLALFAAMVISIMAKEFFWAQWGKRRAAKGSFKCTRRVSGN